MTRKGKRLLFATFIVACTGTAAGLAGVALRSNISLFKSPTELAAEPELVGQRIRIGGLVEEHSLVRAESGRAVSFRVTDGNKELAVAYDGILPDLFREGQGVIAEGKLRADGTFAASSVLAKHDEKYMPREVADALKKSGHWQEGMPASTALKPAADAASKPAP